MKPISMRVVSLMTHRSILLRFLLLYGALYAAFGISSPFLPLFLETRGMGPEALGIVLGATTAVRMISAPLAGRLADRSHAFRLEIAGFAALSAIALLLYLPANAFWILVLVSLFQAAMVAPLVPLSDAVALAVAQPCGNPARGAFEYGWVRGAGSAAFICGLLLAGQSAGRIGLASLMWFGALSLLAVAVAASRLPQISSARTDRPSAEQPRYAWLVLLRQKSFVRLIIVAALVLGSHAMHDSFAIIRWREAGIASSAISVLWSASVAAEVLVFLWIGPFMLQRLSTTAALTIAALSAIVRWTVLAGSTQLLALALVEPLHGFTFALLHLACMRIIAQTVRASLAGTAQALYGVVGIGGTTALLTVGSGWLYARFGSGGFLAMAGLWRCRPAGHLEPAARPFYGIEIACKIEPGHGNQPSLDHSAAAISPLSAA
jgi:MFS transporter, PPP family, 3-phenylpropionic acid transporter